MTIERTPYGRVMDQEVVLFTLKNTQGLVMKATNYGAIVTELHLPDREGRLADVVLGFDKLEGYLQGNAYFGATIGRVGNRITNARFKLAERWYELEANDGANHLHGGVRGWDRAVWRPEATSTEDGPAVRFSYRSPDGESGYPGTVDASVTYTLTNANELRVQMQATTDAVTIINMVHHTYWNLGGSGSGTILDHELQLNADEYTPGTPPDGRVQPVAGTAFDFTKAKAVGVDLEQAGGTPVGFDHNWIVRGESGAVRPVAMLRHPASGRVMTLEANQPGVQFYTGKFLDGTQVGKGARYVQYAGLCLETQAYPNAVNVPTWAEQVILRPNDVYAHSMVHRFSVDGR